MQTKYCLSLVLVLLTACSNQTPQEPLPTQQPSLQPEAITSVPTLRIADNTPTDTLIPISTDEASSTQAPTAQTLPTETSTPVSLESPPKLRDAILSSADVENAVIKFDQVLLTTDVTDELQGSCLRECVKYRYSLKYGVLTIVLLRAGDPQKAERNVANLREDFISLDGYEYLGNDLPSGLHKRPNSWTIALPMDSHARYSNTVAVGTTYGAIVILVTYSKDYCVNSSELGTYCEGDLYMLVEGTGYFVNEQIEKLETIGYPE